MNSIIIWGMGKIGKAYVDSLISCGIKKEKIRLVDSHSGGKYQGIEIKDPESVFYEEYDIVVVSVGEKYKKQIVEQLRNIYKVPEKKIIFSSRTLLLPKRTVFNDDNMMLIDMEENIFGCEQYFNMWYELYKKSLMGMNVGMGSNIESSGELNVLKFLKSSGREIEVLFDVGANIGNYTKNLQSFFPDAKIHCFEPARETFRTLSDNIFGANVILNNMGISNEVKKGKIYFDKENSGLASLYNRQLDYVGVEFGREESVELVTLVY